MATNTNDKLSPEDKALLEEDEQASITQDEALDDARAEQQMIEGAVNTDDNMRRMEQQRSRNQDEPDEDLERDDPVPPKGS